MDALAPADPKVLWPELTEWQSLKENPGVSRVRLGSGDLAYVRPDDGSAPTLRRLRAEGSLPVPEVLDVRQGWMLLSAVAGIPLHDARWRQQPLRAASVAAQALRQLEQAGVRHGDMCLPNILGDIESGQLTGLIDWGDADRHDREIDVASTIWSCGYNGYPEEVGVAVLEQCGWDRTGADEVARLSAVWVAFAGPAIRRLLPATPPAPSNDHAPLVQ